MSESKLVRRQWSVTGIRNDCSVLNLLDKNWIKKKFNFSDDAARTSDIKTCGVVAVKRAIDSREVLRSVAEWGSCEEGLMRCVTRGEVWLMIGVAWEFKTKSDFESAAAEPADEAFEESEADLAASGVVEAILRDFAERTSDCLKRVDKREQINFFYIFLGWFFRSSGVFSRCFRVSGVLDHFGVSDYLGVYDNFGVLKLFRAFWDYFGVFRDLFEVDSGITEYFWDFLASFIGEGYLLGLFTLKNWTRCHHQCLLHQLRWCPIFPRPSENQSSSNSSFFFNFFHM